MLTSVPLGQTLKVSLTNALRYWRLATAPGVAEVEKGSSRLTSCSVHATTVQKNSNKPRARFFKLLGSQRIDSNEPIQPGGPVRQLYSYSVTSLHCLKIQHCYTAMNAKKLYYRMIEDSPENLCVLVLRSLFFGCSVLTRVGRRLFHKLNCVTCKVTMC
jgi:hypothetical protein